MSKVNKEKENYIISEININDDNIDKDIRIINSFENYKREWNLKDKEDDYKYENEKEIKDNCEIEINDKIIDFAYYYKFKTKGNYIIKYSFLNKLKKINHMFRGCNYINKLNLSNFNTQNVTNMEYMFDGCKSLNDLDLSNFNTQNAINMEFMFNKCNSLKSLNLSNFNTQKLINMGYILFHIS